MKSAFLLEKKHFEVEEVNFFNLKIYSKNVILEYTDTDNDYFRRSLFEMVRMRFNIGIYVNITNTDNVHSFVSRFINDIKGFDIKLGVWIENSDNGLELFNRLLPYKHNFILGTRGEFKTKEYTPTWRTNGDIEDKEYVNLDFLREPILRLGIYSDYVSIYDENKFAPILSTHKYD